MTYATFLIAAIGYAVIYALMPNRKVLRARRPTRLWAFGATLLWGGVVFGAGAFGPVIGPIVALTAAMTTGSILILIGPFLIRGLDTE